MLGSDVRLHDSSGRSRPNDARGGAIRKFRVPDSRGRDWGLRPKTEFHSAIIRPRGADGRRISRRKRRNRNPNEFQRRQRFQRRPRNPRRQRPTRRRPWTRTPNPRRKSRPSRSRQLRPRSRHPRWTMVRRNRRKVRDQAPSLRVPRRKPTRLLPRKVLRHRRTEWNRRRPSFQNRGPQRRKATPLKTTLRRPKKCRRRSRRNEARRQHQTHSRRRPLFGQSKVNPRFRRKRRRRKPPIGSQLARVNPPDNRPRFAGARQPKRGRRRKRSRRST